MNAKAKISNVCRRDQHDGRSSNRRGAARLSTPTSAKPGSSDGRFVPSTNLLSMIVAPKPRYGGIMKCFSADQLWS